MGEEKDFIWETLEGKKHSVNEQQKPIPNFLLKFYRFWYMYLKANQITEPQDLYHKISKSAKYWIAIS